MTLALYGSRGSGSAAIEMALQSIGLEYNNVNASRWEPDTLPQLLKVNPLGQIPTLVLDDGSVLTESASILISLALMHPRSGLLPEAAASKFQAIRGLSFIAANCYAAISVHDYPERWTTATTKPAHERVRQGARAQLHRSWEHFADLFGAHESLQAGRPGALAFLAVVVSRWSGARAHLKAQRPRFHEQLMQLSEHPVIAEVLRAHGATA